MDPKLKEEKERLNGGDAQHRRKAQIPALICAETVITNVKR